MESALATLIIMTAVIFSVFTMSDAYFTTEDLLWQARTVMEEQNAVQASTALEFVQSNVTSSGALIELTFRNGGRSKVADYDQWDLIIQHYSAAGIYTVQWLPYVTTPAPGNNEWTVAGIYLSAASGTPEIYEPAILNPGEEIVLQAKVIPPVGPNTVNLATLAVAGGNHQSALVVRE